MNRLLFFLLAILPLTAFAQADWGRIHPHFVGYGSGSYTPGTYTNMARNGSDLIVSGTYSDAGFYASSVYENHYARLRVTAAETTLTLLKKNWWHNLTPGSGELILDSSINLTDPTPPNRHPIFTVAGGYLYQVGGQDYRFKPARSFQPSSVDVSSDEITLDGSGTPVTPYTNLDEVTVKTSGSLPGGLSNSTVYYLIRVSGTKIKLASSLANAKSGTAINLTSQGSGLDSLLREPDHPSDVWKMNLDSTAGDYATWTQVFSTASTAYLMGAAINGQSLVWDSYRNKIVASNLTGSPYGSRRTWSLDVASSAWTEGSQSANGGTAPENQSGQQMTFNTRDSTAWLFGAGNLATGGNELWHYLPSTGLWTQLASISPRPSARAFHCVAYVQGATAADDVLFVSGGTAGDGGAIKRDSWVYHIQADDWDSLAVSTLPTGGHSTCQWEPNSERVVMQSDTTWWVYPIGEDATPPVVVITSPVDGYLTNQGSITVAWTVNGVTQGTQTSEPLDDEGANLVIRCSGVVCDTVTVYRDQTVPVVIITSPGQDTTVNTSTIKVRYTADGVPDSVIFNLNPGNNELIVSATDIAGTGYDTVYVARGTQAPGDPSWPPGASLTATNIRPSSLTLNWSQAQDDSAVSHYEVYLDNASILTLPSSSPRTCNVVGLLMNTAYTFRVEAKDLRGNRSIDGPVRHFTTSNTLPPDPSTTASEIQQSEPTIMASSMSFLYEANPPIQTGVIDSLLKPAHVAVLKGKVQDGNGDSLSGVTVTVVGHPEFGSTVTRSDGEFDLLINGGGKVALRYTAAEYLTVERDAYPRWQEFIALPTVTMISLDTAVTAVDMSSGSFPVARSNVVSDTNGSRQATLIIPSNTMISLTLPNGTILTPDSMHVRMTEYTVGDHGPSAMPGDLPASSGYTYAVEYTVDEALAAGATDVEFNQPIYSYLENFVGIPVGYPVPSAYYDRRKNVWVQTDDGRVIKITGINGGMVDLVVDTTGQTATQAKLDTLGITNQERTRLAALYSVDQTLWRVPVRHFTSYDYNFPVKLPPDAEFPDAEPPGQDEDTRECDTEAGSVIDCHAQALGEEVSAAGFPILSYRSDRVASPRWNTLKIKVSGTDIPWSLKHMDLRVVIAGRVWSFEYSRSANVTETIEWDGKDAYGRTVKGKQPYSYTIAYHYEVNYAPPAPLKKLTGGSSRTFGSASTRPFALTVSSRTWYKLSDVFTGYLGTAEVEDLGPGWSLSDHHHYDPTSGVLHLGNGENQGVDAGLGAIYTVAGGGGQVPALGVRIPAKQANINSINALDIGPDGAVYVGDRGSGRLWKLESDGMISIIATGNWFGDVDYAPDGNIYATSLDNHRVARITPQGQLQVVAGTGTAGFSGDGGPATLARLNGPNAGVMGPDGSLYIADRANSRVRRVSPDGIIQTVAGTGSNTFNGDGLPGLLTNMSVSHLAVGDDGSIYVSDVVNCRIRRIDPTGTVTTVAGDGTSGTDLIPCFRTQPSGRFGLIRSIQWNRERDVNTTPSSRNVRCSWPRIWAT